MHFTETKHNQSALTKRGGGLDAGSVVMQPCHGRGHERIIH